MAAKFGAQPRSVIAAARQTWIISGTPAAVSVWWPRPFVAAQEIPPHFPFGFGSGPGAPAQQHYTVFCHGVIPVALRPWPPPLVVAQEVPPTFPFKPGETTSWHGVIPVPLVKPAPITQAYQSQHPLPYAWPFPASGDGIYGELLTIFFSGPAPVPLLKPAAPQHISQSVPPDFPFGAGWAVWASGPVQTAKLWSPTVINHTVPPDYPFAGAVMVASVLPPTAVPVISTPAVPVSSGEPYLPDFPPPGSAAASSGVVSVLSVKPTIPQQTAQATPAEFPFAGSVLIAHGLPSLVRPVAPIMAAETTPTGYPGVPGSVFVSSAYVSVITPPSIQRPPGVLALETLPLEFPAAGLAFISHGQAPPSGFSGSGAVTAPLAAASITGGVTAAFGAGGGGAGLIAPPSLSSPTHVPYHRRPGHFGRGAVRASAAEVSAFATELTVPATRPPAKSKSRRSNMDLSIIRALDEAMLVGGLEAMILEEDRLLIG